MTLPLKGSRTGDLSNAEEVARIVADCEGPDGLIARFEAARNGIGAAAAKPGSLPDVVARWKASELWPERGRSQDFYTKSLRPIDEWSAARAHPHIGAMKLQTIMQFLALYADRPAQQRALKATLSAMFSFALRDGIIAAHPFGVAVRIRRKKIAKRPVELWHAEDVDAYAHAAEKIGWPSGARLLRLMWETSADASDVVTWNRREHFRDDAKPAILYDRGKTGVPAATRISTALAVGLRTCGALYFVTDQHGAPYAPDSPKDDNRRGGLLRRVRAQAVKDGARALVFDHLRHSAATDAIEHGAAEEDIPALTAHTDVVMARQVYIQKTEAQSERVQRARGIIE